MAWMPARSVDTGAHTTEDGQQRDHAFRLSVLVPTRNESGNVEPLVQRLRLALRGIPCEVLFVDDSDDSTPAVVDALARSGGEDGFQVSLLHRSPGSRDGGLGGAVVAGLRRAAGEWVCVIDGDLQHPPELVPQLLETALADDADLVVASRFLAQGDGTALPPVRTLISRVAAATAKATFSRALGSLSDPMSGFFLVRREAVDPDVLQPVGFKILVEIVVRTRGLRIAELPYTFAVRHSGDSKATSGEGLGFARHLARLRFRRSAASRRRSNTYDIHGILSVESDGRLPELEAFRVARLDRPADIRVRIGRLPESPVEVSDSDRFTRQLRYEEKTRGFGFAADIRMGERVEVLAAPLLRHSPHVLYTNLVEPILRWEFVRRGYALAHGACVVRGNDAFMVTARTDTGKTTTMLKLLDAHPFGFIADDLTIVRPDGGVLPYPKPLTISKHTLHAVKTPLLTRRERATLGLQSRLHSRSGRRFAFFLTRTGLPVATVNTVVQLLVPPPKYPVQRLVPGVEIAERGDLGGLLVIQRAAHGFEWLDEEDALEILLGNCEDAYGFPPYHMIEDFLLDGSADDLRAVERQILAGAFEGVAAALLSSTKLDWATRIPTLIDGLPADLEADLRSVGNEAAARSTVPETISSRELDEPAVVESDGAAR
jgi:glycosyltransferase involved in cell wall biosynthesis